VEALSGQTLPKSWRAAVALVVAVYAVVLARSTCFGVGGADSAGYFCGSKIIAGGRFWVPIEPLDRLHLTDKWSHVFLPLAMDEAPPPKTMGPHYPLGFPAHIVAAAKLFGWSRAPYLVAPFAALLTLFITYLLARELELSPKWSVAVVAMLAASATFFFQAIQPMSDIVATLWCTLAVFFAVRSRRDWRWAAACGVAMAVAVWVRPANVILMPVLALALGIRVRSWLALAAGAAPLAILWMIVNRILYGSPLTTGYGSVFSWMLLSNAKVFFPRYISYMLKLVTPIIFPGAFLVAFDRSIPTWQRAMLVIWFWAFFTFYSFGLQDDAWWYTRYMLPGFPALMIAAALVLRRWTNRRPQVAFVLVALVVVVGIGHIANFHLTKLHEQEETYPAAVQWSEKLLPRDALVASSMLSGSFYFYSGRFTARMEQVDPNEFEELRAYVGAADMHWYAVIFDWEMPELMKAMPGRWTTINSMKNVLLLRLDS
jgi:hypothetical protein